MHDRAQRMPRTVAAFLSGEKAGDFVISVEVARKEGLRMALSPRIDLGWNWED